MTGFNGLPPSWFRVMQSMVRVRPVMDFTVLTESIRSLAGSVEPIVKLQEGIAASFKLQEGIAASLASSFEVFNELSRQWNAGMGAMLAQFTESLRSYIHSQHRFYAIMLQLGWPPPLAVPVNIMEDIIREYDEKGLTAAGDTADRLLLDWYDAEAVAEMAGEWEQNALLTRRLPILRQVVDAHQGGHYALCVPTILAQIEGLIADGFQHRGQMRGGQYKARIEELLGSENAGWTDQVAKEFILATVLANFEHGNPIPSNLSRHAILHGADTDYGTATNSLKALLLFTYLQDSFRELSAEHD